MEYKEHKGVRNAINQLTTEAFEENHLHYLNDTYTGLMIMPIHQIFQYLHDMHGNMIDLDLRLNEERTKQSWNQE